MQKLFVENKLGDLSGGLNDHFRNVVFSEMIDIMGADHGGYIKRMEAAVNALTQGQGSLDVKLCHMVNLMENGKPIKMSKRSGAFTKTGL